MRAVETILSRSFKKAMGLGDRVVRLRAHKGDGGGRWSTAHLKPNLDGGDHDFGRIASYEGADRAEIGRIQAAAVGPAVRGN